MIIIRVSTFNGLSIAMEVLCTLKCFCFKYGIQDQVVYRWGYCSIM